MARTSPPRPPDVTVHFPGIAPLARTTVRLHPRPGETPAELTQRLHDAIES